MREMACAWFLCVRILYASGPWSCFKPFSVTHPDHSMTVNNLLELFYEVGNMTPADHLTHISNNFFSCVCETHPTIINPFLLTSTKLTWPSLSLIQLATSCLFNRTPNLSLFPVSLIPAKWISLSFSLSSL